MPSTTAAGTGLAISAGVPATQDASGYGALSYTEVSNVESLGGFGATTEVTTFQPLKGAQQKHKGPTNYGALNPTIALDDADAGQALLVVASAPTNSALYAVRVTKPDGSLRYMQVRVFGMPETIGAANSMITAAPILEINTPVVKVGVTGTPLPVFTVQPTISPASGAVGTTFTASDGAASNATGYTRRWLLGSTAIGTGTTVTPNAAGSLTLEVTATGPGGTKQATTSAVTVSSGATPAPAPAPIIGMTSANTAKVRAAATSTTRDALIVAVGPSTTGGQSTGAGTAQATGAWPVQAAAQLQAQGTNAGAANFFGDKAGWGGAQTAANFMGGDSRVVLTGSAAPTSFGTVGGSGFGMNAAAGSIAFTPTTSVNKFDVWYRDAAGQDWAWSIDGGAFTTVSGAANTGAPTKLTIPAGTAGTHTLTIEWRAGNARFAGVSGYNDTGSRRQLTFLNLGISGARSARFIEDTDTVASSMKMLTALAPDLTILDSWAINDWRNSVTVDTFKTNLAAGITKAKVSGDVLVCTPLWDNGTSGLSADQDSYAQATIDVAAAAGVPVLDIRAAWQSWTAANAKGWYSDTVHPTAAGYAAIAQAVVYFIQQAKLAA